MKMFFACVFALVASVAGAQPAHIGPGAPSVERARQVVLGTAAEFPAQVAQGSNVDVMEELMRRMIWHMQVAGMQAGRQKNPSGAISKDKLTAFLDGAWHVYDVLSDRASGPFDVHMDEVPLPNYQADLGIADEGGAPLPPYVPPTQPAPTPGICLPFPDPNVPRLEGALRDFAVESAARQERIFANLTEQLLQCRTMQQTTFDLLKRHDEEPMFVSKLLKNRLVQLGLAAISARFLPGLFGGK